MSAFAQPVSLLLMGQSVTVEIQIQVNYTL